jgi:hypothetical protein
LIPLSLREFHSHRIPEKLLSLTQTPVGYGHSILKAEEVISEVNEQPVIKKNTTGGKYIRFLCNKL